MELNNERENESAIISHSITVLHNSAKNDQEMPNITHCLVIRCDAKQ